MHHSAELNEDVLNELIGLPTLRVKRVFVNRARAKASLTALKSKPIHIQADRVEIEAEELAVAGPLPETLAKLIGPSDPNAKPVDYGFGDRIGDGISFEVGEVVIRFQTLGVKNGVKTDEPGPWTPPCLCILVNQVKWFSTDRFWEVPTVLTMTFSFSDLTCVPPDCLLGGGRTRRYVGVEQRAVRCRKH